MAERPEGLAQDQVADDRPRSLGLGRIVLAVYWIFGLVTSAIAVVDLVNHGQGALGPRFVSLLGGLVYLVAAAALTHNGRRMRVVGWSCVVVELLGPIIVGLVGLGIPEVSGARSVWADFGADFWYLPIAIPVVGLVWLWWSDPRRIVELAAQVERQGLARGR